MTPPDGHEQVDTAGYGGKRCERGHIPPLACCSLPVIGYRWQAHRQGASMSEHKPLTRTAQGFNLGKAVTALGIGVMLATQVPEMPLTPLIPHTPAIIAPRENDLVDVYREITGEDEVEYDEQNSPPAVSESLE